VVDGRLDYIGADVCPNQVVTYRNGIEGQIENWNYLTPVEITGGMQIVGNVATVTANFRMLDSGYNYNNHQAVLFIYEDDVTWCCGYGGVSHWDEVVRMVRSTPVSLTFQGQEVQVQQALTLTGQSVPINPANLHAVAVYETIGGTQETIQATNFEPFSNFFVPVFNDRIEAVPAGFGTALFPGSIQNVAENADLVDLSISGFSGSWTVDFQVEGDPNWYTQYSLPLDPAETVDVTLRVQTDGEVRIGEGALVAESQVGGQLFEVAMQVFNGSPAILMVDDDGTSTFETDFTAGLTTSGYLYNLHAVTSGDDGPSTAVMSQYDAVVWQTGFGLSTLSASDIINLRAYLDNGGGLFLQSMEYLSTNGANVFTRDYLGVDSYVNNAKATNCVGVAGDPITDGMSFVPLQWPAPAYNKADRTVPRAEAAAIFHNELSDPVAVRYEMPNGTRTVFNTVMLVAYTNGADPNNRASVVGRTMDWILENDPADAPTTDLPTPRVSQMMAASPNPFAPATELRFALSNAAALEPVSLVVIDAAGRQVRTLVDGSLEPGQHQVAWDGRDESGRDAPSGLYFAVLRTVDGASSSKLTRLE
jgi:hypothetical protein